MNFIETLKRCIDVELGSTHSVDPEKIKEVRAMAEFENTQHVLALKYRYGNGGISSEVFDKTMRDYLDKKTELEEMEYQNLRRRGDLMKLKTHLQNAQYMVDCELNRQNS